MKKNDNYDAEAIAADLENLGEEIANDTERTLAETHPREFRFEEWQRMREAIKAMRGMLDEMEEMINRAENEANDYDEDLESEWD